MKTVTIKEAYKQWANRYEEDLPYLFESESEKVIPLIGNVKNKQVLDLGFKELYFIEENNLSIYKNDNPVLMRIILQK